MKCRLLAVALVGTLGLCAAEVQTPKRYLVFTAHPDDGDILFGGTAIKLAKAGHVVKFVSASNGNRGHQSMGMDELAKRRYGETQEAKRVAGLAEYEVWDINDCEVVCNLVLRGRVIRAIRNFRPDVVITHRPYDYHPDHRNIANAVLDAAYLATVPHYCDDVAPDSKTAVYAYVYDRFTDPRPIRADAVVDIDPVMEQKLKMLDCHKSQFYEWLRWDRGFKNDSFENQPWDKKREWLISIWGKRTENMAAHGRARLVETLGERGASVRNAELFELSHYGKVVPIDEFNHLFNPPKVISKDHSTVGN